MSRYNQRRDEESKPVRRRRMSVLHQPESDGNVDWRMRGKADSLEDFEDLDILDEEDFVDLDDEGEDEDEFDFDDDEDDEDIDFGDEDVGL